MTATDLDSAMAARCAELQIQWKDLALRADLDVSHLRKIRRGQVDLTYPVARRIDAALKWPSGTAADEYRKPPGDTEINTEMLAHLHKAWTRTIDRPEISPAVRRERADLLMEYWTLMERSRKRFDATVDRFVAEIRVSLDTESDALQRISEYSPPGGGA